MKWLLALLVAPLCWGQTANSFQFDPPAVPVGAASVILYVPISGAATRVTLEPSWQTTDLDLHDDGVSPDKVAGDRIFSINVPLAKLTMTPDDVFRPFLGFLKLWTGATVVVRYNIFLSMAAPDIPRMQIVDDSSTMRHTAYVVNILAPEAFPVSTSAVLGNFTPSRRNSTSVSATTTTCSILSGRRRRSFRIAIIRPSKTQPAESESLSSIAAPCIPARARS